MPLRLHYGDDDFAARFSALVDAERGAAGDVGGVVAEIVAAVRRDGDTALLAYTERFDGHALSAAMQVDREIAAARGQVAPEVVAALETLARRIEAFHSRQLPQDLDYVDDDGIGLGQRWRPIAAAELYVPGGRAAYPSLLMNRDPGARRRSGRPPSDGHADPDGRVNLILVAAEIAGIDGFTLGGAQRRSAVPMARRRYPGR